MYQEILYEIVIFDHIWGGVAYEHLLPETFAAGAVFRSSALCLFIIIFNFTKHTFFIKWKNWMYQCTRTFFDRLYTAFSHTGIV